MLDEISIASLATYPNAGARLSGLKAVNYLFGMNGSGKTTISRVIADPDRYATCTLTWRTNRPLECMVFNSDFSRNNYAASMPGIFTLGENSAESLAKIEELRTKITGFDRDIDNLVANLGSTETKSGKRGELSALYSTFEEKIWKIKLRYDAEFQPAFDGVRSSKTKFCERALSEWERNGSPIEEIDDLKQKAATVFDSALQRVALLPLFGYDNLVGLETSAILGKRIVGKEDIDVAALIRRLGNSDWVRAGLGYIGPTGGPCPFCQQDMSNDLARHLNEYFDEVYLQDIAAIQRLTTSYDAFARTLVNNLENIASAECAQLDGATFRADMDRLIARISSNTHQLEIKRKEPSVPVTLEGIGELAKALCDQIEGANRSIVELNTIVDNLATEQTALKALIWKAVLEENRDNIVEYIGQKDVLERAVAGMTNALQAKRTMRETARAELTALERSITSVRPTVNAINSILRSFHFTGFTLKTAGTNESFYEIVRNDGSNAAINLSEGERNFITFLYFYHLLRGSIIESGTTTNRIVIFDDPISSLDSDVLFIVSTLIKRVIGEAATGTGNIKQVFVLTHNIYFHKEVSFDTRRSGGLMAHESFWVVRKVDGVTALVNYNHNPIKTSYELLWAEVKSTARPTITIQNTLRRIIENYFKILGNLDKDEIVARFEGRDQQICNSLFSWLNDGSHGVHDDLYVSTDDQTVARYLEVFRRIFEVTGHERHYWMMMGSEPVSLTPIATEVAGADVPAVA